jgi:hypothetical protein
MKKSQVLIFQFILFFLLGLAIFIGVGSVFRLQLDILTTDVLTQSLGLTNSFLNSAIIYSVVGCKGCDKINISLSLPEKITHYYYKINFFDDGIRVSALDRPEYFFSTYHNLNYTIKFSGEAFSIKPVILMFNGVNYKLEVGQ